MGRNGVSLKMAENKTSYASYPAVSNTVYDGLVSTPTQLDELNSFFTLSTLIGISNKCKERLREKGIELTVSKI